MHGHPLQPHRQVGPPQRPTGLGAVPLPIVSLRGTRASSLYRPGTRASGLTDNPSGLTDNPNRICGALNPILLHISAFRDMIMLAQTQATVIEHMARSEKGIEFLVVIITSIVIAVISHRVRHRHRYSPEDMH